MQKFIPYILAIILAAGAYFTGSSVNDSIGIALDKEKTKAACIELLEGEADESVPAIDTNEATP